MNNVADRVIAQRLQEFIDDLGIIPSEEIDSSTQSPGEDML